jgi:biopolymer transport protein ExbB
MDISSRLLTFTLHGSGWVLWLLIALSVISSAVIAERFWFFARYRVHPLSLAHDMHDLLRSKEGAADGNALEGAMAGAKAKERQRLERNLAYLGTLGSNAPFIGLFGTVLGIIKAFHDLSGTQAGQGSGPAVVMGSLSEALVATAVGLMVAIPAVVAFNYFNRRVRASMTEVDWMAHLALGLVQDGDADDAEAT